MTAPSGDPLQSTTDGETVYSMLDGLGSVTGTLDAAGGVASTSAYSVFGQPAGMGAVGLGDAFGYTGHAWDADAGMHFARARWYDAGAGRFASEDPVDAMNLYPYVGNQPMDWVDPTGEMFIEYRGLVDAGADLAVTVAGHAWDLMKQGFEKAMEESSEFFLSAGRTINANAGIVCAFATFFAVAAFARKVLLGSIASPPGKRAGPPARSVRVGLVGALDKVVTLATFTVAVAAWGVPDGPCQTSLG